LLEKPVDEGGLPMVDMGDDGDIAKLHGIRNVQRGPQTARGSYDSDIERV
jgi:hypothetical protein